MSGPSRIDRSGPSRIDREAAAKYVQCVLGKCDDDPGVNDCIRRMTHDTIARRLCVDTGIVKRAAWVVEYLSFDFDCSLARHFGDDELTDLFVANLDDIFREVVTKGENADFGPLIDKWTKDAIRIGKGEPASGRGA